MAATDNVGFRTLWGYLKEVGRELRKPSSWFFIIVALVLATKALEVIRMHRGQPPLFGPLVAPLLKELGGFMNEPGAAERYMSRIPAFVIQILIPFMAVWGWYFISGWKRLAGHPFRAFFAGLVQTWRNFGLSLACLRRWWKILLLIFCIMIPFIYAFATTPGFRKSYPYLDRLRANRTQIEQIDKKLHSVPAQPATNQAAVATTATAGSVAPAQSRTAAAEKVDEREKIAASRTALVWGTVWLLFLFEFLRMFYMISWEFFFRGFMLQGMLRLGLGWHAVWIQMLPYVMLHSTKPSIELYYTIPSGLLLGVLAWKAGSIWPGFLLHFVGAVLFDVFAMFA